MISTNKLAVGIGMIVSFLSVSVHAQSAGPGLNQFAANGISFDYPAGYSVTEESTPEAWQFVITRKGSSVRLTVVVSQRPALRNELPEAIEKFKEPLLKKAAAALGPAKNPPERASFQTLIGTKEAEGIRLRAATGGTKTAEVIWARWSLRLIGLVLLKSEANESVGSRLWQTVSASLRVEAPVIFGVAAVPEPTENKKIEGGVLNGKALALPQPAYPALARAANVSGTVSVQVLIDEQGNVISARAVDGHPLLQAACVAAARKARFLPTSLEGEPVRVMGVIRYTFLQR